MYSFPPRRYLTECDFALLAAGGQMKLGLIGLGKMGTGMAKSWLRAGHQLIVYNRTRDKAEALRAEGAHVATSLAEVCATGFAATMVADDSALEALVFAADGILASLPKNGIHISHSTVSVALSDRLAGDHKKAGQRFVSAPVFGRPDAAESAKLAVVAAGDSEALNQVKPLLDALGPKLLVLGERASQANAVKLAGNFLITTALESLAEAFTFAKKSGVDPAVFLDFLTSSFLNAPVYKTYGGLIVEGKYDDAMFTAALALKDVRLVLQAAEAAGVPMPVASVVRDRFLTAIARGNAEKDVSILGRIAAEDAGIPAVRAHSAS
jgi:3-hydroxyisobutyrate dehydrogenase-like beta-hydroxyacid dehydrogenase